MSTLLLIALAAAFVGLITSSVVLFKLLKEDKAQRFQY